ncbi:MAG: sodium-independent anion transporter, partial [Acidimicrobiia bacterium]
MTRRRVLLPGLPTTGYGREEARSDLVGGITVAVMLIPQAMAYATLAGMPPVTGLYAALVPLVAYALFGTSGQLAVGPVALIALLTADGLADFAGGDLDAYVAGAATLALMVG